MTTEKPLNTKQRMIGVCAAFAAPLAALAVEFGTPFSDNMVLQRGRTVPIWGTAEPGEPVVVSFAGQTKTAKADAKGAWRVNLDAMEASRENRILTAKGASEAKSVGNVLVGEVWFASGQSNMDCPIWGKSPRYRDGNGRMMTLMTRRPFIRYAKNDYIQSAEPRLGWKAVWRDYSPSSFRARPLSAVAFYYALELYGALDVPVGVIDSSWGGSRIEPWIPRAQGEAVVPLAEDSRVRFCQPHTMFNGMVAAYAPFAMRGMIWYQGCANAGEPYRYCGKMHDLYDGWAREFENPDLSLYFVQLAPYRSNYFNIRLAQAQFAAEEKNAAMAVICDAGNMNDIHPNGKEIVARRLALHALKRNYGFADIIDDSPTLKDWRVEDGKFILAFDNATSWYVYNANYSMNVHGFEVATANGKFVAAKVLNKNVDRRGTFEGRELVVAADGVTKPCRLRYLARAPYTGTLYALDSGLPLGPFEIDAREAGWHRRAGGVAFGDALKVNELDGYRTILAAELPAFRAFKDVGYTRDMTGNVQPFSRVAYVLELERRDGTVDWVVAAMDAFTADAAKLGVPCEKGTCFQQKVANLVVRSNVASVEEGARGEGIVEFFSGNYSTGVKLQGAGGDGGKYDINDTPCASPDPGYGSMQVHDAGRAVTVFAYNKFNGGAADVGIGSNTDGENPDWTFMGNADLYKSRRLTVLVK